MPHVYDFSKLTIIQQMKVHPKGWVEPLFVEYGMGIHGTTPSYFWRVKETNHTFVIPVLRMNFLSSGDYGKHFDEYLEGFRQEYLEWKSEGFYVPWMKEYQEIYRNFIVE
jgi:hypothetical protein